MADWAEKSRQLDAYLRLRSRPVATKFLEKMEDIEKIPGVRKLEGTLASCQRISLARLFGYTVSETALDTPPWCSYHLGLCEVPEAIESGKLTLGVQREVPVDARKPRDPSLLIPAGKHEAIVFSPLERERFEPDIIIVYANPAQMLLLLRGLQFRDDQPFDFPCALDASCAQSIAHCYLTGRPSLAIPDYGEREYGTVLDDELEIALPPQVFDDLLDGLSACSKAGLRYPIRSYGARADVLMGQPPQFREFHHQEVERLRKKKAMKG